MITRIVAKVFGLMLLMMELSLPSPVGVEDKMYSFFIMLIGSIALAVGMEK